MRVGYLLALGATFALLLPAGSFAQGGSLPSNGSALDQYVESVPDGQGGRPSNDVAGSSGGGGGAGGSAGPSIGGGLQTLGTDGAAAARLATATSPAVDVDDSAVGDGSSESESGAAAGSQGSGGGGSGGAGAPLVADARDSGDTASDAIGSLLGGEFGSAGLGDALPFILLAILLVALGTAALRSRRSGRGQKTP